MRFDKGIMNFNTDLLKDVFEENNKFFNLKKQNDKLIDCLIDP